MTQTVTPDHELAQALRGRTQAWGRRHFVGGAWVALPERPDRRSVGEEFLRQGRRRAAP